MLVLTRKSDQSIVIGGDVEISVLKISKNQVQLGINAPSHIPIYRHEIYEQVKAANRTASQALPTQRTEMKNMLSGLQARIREGAAKGSQDASAS